MRQLIKQMRNDMTTEPGNKVQLEVPRSIYYRIKALALADDSRSQERIPYKDKVLECLVAGMELLETQEREINV